MEPIRLLVADDHLVLLEALATRFTMVEGFAVVAALADSATVAPAAVKTRPDVALLDVFMPPGGGIAAARQLRKLLPSCGVVLMTAIPRPALLSRAVEDGVLGVVRKSAPLAELVSVLHAAAAGQRRIDPAIDAAIGTLHASPLSGREAEVLRLAMTGISIAELAKRVCLAEGTVRNLVSASMKKLNARNRFDAARIALEQGLLLTLARSPRTAVTVHSGLWSSRPLRSANTPAWKRLRAPRRCISDSTMRRDVRGLTPSRFATVSSVYP